MPSYVLFENHIPHVSSFFLFEYYASSDPSASVTVMTTYEDSIMSLIVGQMSARKSHLFSPGVTNELV